MTAKSSVPAPFVPSPSASAPSESMSGAMAAIGVSVLLLFCFFAIAAGHSEVACALASLVWAIWVTVWICKIKNRQTEAVKVQTDAVEILANILSELKKQNC